MKVLKRPKGLKSLSLFFVFFVFFGLCLFNMLYLPFKAFAAHPLVTDDTGTQGRGNFQLELNGEYGHDKENAVTEEITELAPTLSFGITDPIDAVLTLPYQSVLIDDSGSLTRENGVSDLTLEIKWRFYENSGLSFAVKPGIILPTGDNDKGLGSGKTNWQLFLIGTGEIKPWVFHVNLGYIKNENKNDERENLWHASLAATFEVMDNLQVVGNVGIERETDTAGNTNPAFILGGLIYSLSENIDIDFGLKHELNTTETDYSILAGLTWRF